MSNSYGLCCKYCEPYPYPEKRWLWHDEFPKLWAREQKTTSVDFWQNSTPFSLQILRQTCFSMFPNWLACRIGNLIHYHGRNVHLGKGHQARWLREELTKSEWFGKAMDEWQMRKSFFLWLLPQKLTGHWKTKHLKMYLLLNMVIFHCHVSFQGCTCWNPRMLYWDLLLIFIWVERLSAIDSWNDSMTPNMNIAFFFWNEAAH